MSTPLRLLVLAAGLSIGCGKNMSSPEPTASSREAIMQVWHGHFIIPSASPGRDLREMPPRVIRTDAGYDQFVALIPEHRVQKRQPAPPSDDPLLARPRIDFATHALVVGFRTDTMQPGLFEPTITVTDDLVTVRLADKDPGDSAMAARRMDVGAYVAVLVEHGGRAITVED